jgi:2,3-dihydroxybenzoate decarboxylase
MRYIAIEEAFSIPELAERQSSPWPPNRFSQIHLADWGRRLPDFTEYRKPGMDAAGIDIQVLSLTVPGLQADLGAPAALDDARFANDYLVRVVAEHSDRFRGFAALPMQDPAAAVTELGRCARELGFRGALVNDHLRGHYLDEPRYDQVWAALEELSVPLYLHPGARRQTGGRCSTAAPSYMARPGAGPLRPAGTHCASSTAESLTATPELG